MGSEGAVTPSGTNSTTSDHGQTQAEGDSDGEPKEVVQSPEVLAAIAKARAAPLYQDLSEKHRSDAAKEAMGLTQQEGDGMLDDLEDLFGLGDDGKGGGMVLGGSVWEWVTGGGPPACGRP